MNELSGLTTAREILTAALFREEAAHRFYEEVLRSTKVDFIRDLATQLSEEEQRHILLIQKKLTELDMGHP